MRSFRQGIKHERRKIKSGAKAASAPLEPKEEEKPPSRTADLGHQFLIAALQQQHQFGGVSSPGSVEGSC